MPLIQGLYDALPYIDSFPNATDYAKISALLDSSSTSSSSSSTTLHPSIPPLLPSKLTPLLSAELDRISTSNPLSAIDTSRYESADSPTASDAISAQHTILRRAYAASSHLHVRLQNLALLEQFGRNAWLVGNAQLEDMLRPLERELMAAREEVERVEDERRRGQTEVGAEMDALEETWRGGVGRLLEVLVAGEEMKEKVLEARRAAAR